MNKKGVSDVVTTVLLVLIGIAAIALLGVVIFSFIRGGQLSNSLNPYTSNTKFTLSPLTSDDMQFDRFQIQNTGQTTLTSYVVKIDNTQQPLILQRSLQPQEQKYFYLSSAYPVGAHSLSVTSGDHTEVLQISISPDWHVIITNTTVS